jgi:hypothetical protein
MRSARDTGRIIGLLLFFQLAGLIVPFVLLHPLTTGPENYLVNAAGSASQIKLAVLLLFANCFLTIAIAITALPALRRSSEAMALWLLVASVIMFSAQALDNVQILSMLSLSQRYGQTTGPDQLWQSFAAVVGTTRRWAHYSWLLLIDCWIFSLYSILFRFVLVPRLLASFGLGTVILHFTAIPLRGFLDLSLVTQLGVPMAFSHIALATWLVAKGFSDVVSRPTAD